MKTFKFIVLAVSLSFFFSCQCKTKESDCPSTEKKIGLQLYSVRDTINKDFKGTIAALAEMGFKDVEAAGYINGKFYGLTPEEFKAELEAVGLSALSSHTTIQLAEDVSKTNWEEVWKWWDTCIAAHKAAGMKYIVAPWMAVPKTLADLKVYCDYYNQIGAKCKEAGLSFGYHKYIYSWKLDNVKISTILKGDNYKIQMAALYTSIHILPPEEDDSGL